MNDLKMLLVLMLLIIPACTVPKNNSAGKICASCDIQPDQVVRLSKVQPPLDGEQRPLVYDHDGALDDYHALVVASQLPHYALRAATVVCGESILSKNGIDDASRATWQILSLLGQADVPVGANTVCGRNHFPEAFRAVIEPVVNLPIFREVTTTPPKLRDAGELLAETIRASSVPVTILAAGPLTTIRDILRDEPSLRGNIAEIVIMGGALRVDGNTIMQKPQVADMSAEFNFFIDPPATKAILESGLPIRIMPLDATNHVIITEDVIDNIGSGVGKPTQIIKQILEIERTIIRKYIGLSLWDVLAAMSLERPDLFTWERVGIRIETDNPKGGQIVEDPRSPHHVLIATAAKRAALIAFEKDLLR